MSQKCLKLLKFLKLLKILDQTVYLEHYTLNTGALEMLIQVVIFC